MNDTPEYPPEVHAAVEQFKRLRGVVDVFCHLLSLETVLAEDLGSFAYAKLPIGSLRRTNGGRSGEGLLQVELSVCRDENGCRTVEFLAWHFRDAARGGEINEFRPFALPPVAGPRVQLGRTLSFVLDLFETDQSDGAPLRRMRKLADGLKTSIDPYNRMLIERGDPGLVK